MRKLVILICFLILSMPVFALNSNAVNESLQFLNSSIQPRVANINKTLLNDNEKITNIINLYKQNPNNIKTRDTYIFGLACTNQYRSLLKTFDNDYFKPAYEKYLEFDKTLTFDDWKHSVALSETSSFYDFYTFAEYNLDNCKKIVERSTSH